MRFEMDNSLMGEILFYMENQDGTFLFDTMEGQIINPDDIFEDEPDFDDEQRFISLPEWTTQDGYRLMERFTSASRNPVIREELSAALNRGRGVFRSFKNVLEQHPETEKLWFVFKEREMKNEVIAWYNAYREIWGLELVGPGPEDTSALILEDFILREGTAADAEEAAVLHNHCVEERRARSGESASAVFEAMNPGVFPGGLCFVAETKNGDFAGYICAAKDATALHICALEVIPEYRGLGLGKALLGKLLEAVPEKATITIDIPADTEKYTQALYRENFEPCVQRFIRRSVPQSD
jgi:ribosomal protein S18 acetylase RimI-like enzyme